MKILSLTAGVPGSGKSTWIKENKPDAIIISRDAIRFSLLKDGEDYFSHEDEVLEIFYDKIQRAIDADDDIEVIVDATHLNKKSRDNLFNHLNIENVDYRKIYFFKVDLNTCIERNNQRSGRALVPVDVIKRMFYGLKLPEENECFDEVVIIDKNGKEMI